MKIVERSFRRKHLGGHRAVKKLKVIFRDSRFAIPQLRLLWLPLFLCSAPFSGNLIEVPARTPEAGAKSNELASFVKRAVGEL